MMNNTNSVAWRHGMNLPWAGLRTVPGLLFAIGLGALVPIASALDSDQEQPATLEADTFEIDLQSGQRVYRGNVLYRQGSIRLECDELVTDFNDEGELDKAVCTGDPGKFKQRPEGSEDDMLGEARTITLDQITGFVKMKSRAEVVQGGTKINGRLLTYNLNTEKVVVEGDASGTSGKAAEPKSETAGEQETGESASAVDDKPSRPTIVIQPRKKKKATE